MILRSNPMLYPSPKDCECCIDYPTRSDHATASIEFCLAIKWGLRNRIIQPFSADSKSLRDFCKNAYITKKPGKHQLPGLSFIDIVVLYTYTTSGHLTEPRILAYAGSFVSAVSGSIISVASGSSQLASRVRTYCRSLSDKS